MRTSRNNILAAALALAFTAGCGNTQQSQERKVQLTGLAPDDIKANFDGDITLTGTGFNLGTEVLVNGQPAAQAGFASVQFVDAGTLKLVRNYAGPGDELASGDRSIEVRTGLERSEALPLHVRPFLQMMDHVRSLPGEDLTVAGGTLHVWVRPFDSDGVLIRPGHELAGSHGLDPAHFRWENVRFTLDTSSQPVLAASSAVASLDYDPVNDTRPLAVSLVIDQSGSMIGGTNPADPGDERVNQAQGFVSRLGPHDRVSVWKFQASTVVNVVPMTDDKQAVLDGLETLRDGEAGNTPLYNAAKSGVEDVAPLGTGYVRASIVLTDGIDNASQVTVLDVIDLARTEGVPVFPIGLGNPNDPNSLDRDELQQLANETGGLFLFAEDPTALGSVFDFLSEILASSYRLDTTVAFNPPITQAGNYTIEADIVCAVDGEEVRIAMPPFRASVVN